MSTKRLIEVHLPIAELSEESTRERRRPTSLPPINFLHVWWARRPLVASRAAILASLLPADADRDQFLETLGIHGDPVAVKKKIDNANRRGVDLGTDPYGYPRAFTFSPAVAVEDAFGELSSKTVLDPTAGGGSIPFEAMRLGASGIANDLNPVAALILKATLQYPSQHGSIVLDEFNRIAAEFEAEAIARLEGVYPKEDKDTKIDGYLWARTIECPYCSGTVPLAPNWRLSPTGAGISIVPVTDGETRVCRTVVVDDIAEHSVGTVASGDGVCPFPDCGRSISGDIIKGQAQAGRMGDQLIAVAAKRKSIVGQNKSGSPKHKWVRDFRSPDASDLNHNEISVRLNSEMEEWSVLDLVPTEDIPTGSKTDEARRYGMFKWTDMFSPRQLLAHATSVSVYQEILTKYQRSGEMSDVRKAAFVYLSFSLDKLLNYNSRMSIWMPTREVIANTFNRHDFAFCWTYAEMSHGVTGSGIAWSLEQVRDSLKKILSLVKNDSDQLALDDNKKLVPSVVINRSGADLPSIPAKSVDAVIMDPPYGANVMYAELSDFFYVWLKRTAGFVVPEMFSRNLADKQSEAVANKAHFQGQKGAAKLADADYRDKMSAIFSECHRVLKVDGIMTVMFTHKDTGAWDALAMSLMDAGFVITASWPVNTEAESSLHIKDKAAANSTIFLVCRPRGDAQEETMYWEDVEPMVRRAVKDRVGEFQAAGIQGVDLYLASFGPALEAFSRHWPLTRGTPAPEPKRKRKAQGDLLEEFDPYAVRPEDALNAARREVKAWRLAQLASAKAQADMDGPTAFYVLAWDAFKAVSFPYDEALRLARAVGVDIEAEVIGRLAEKKAAEIKLWDSATRVAKGALGPANGARGMIDALHHAANVMRTRGAEAAQEMLEVAGIAHDDEFKVALEALLEVLPPSKTFSGIDADKAVKPAADDFDALEKLRRIAYANEIGEPQQLDLYREMMAAE